MEDKTTNAVKDTRKVLGIISIVAFDNGDIELKFAGVQKENLHKIFGHFEKLAKEYASD